MAFTNSPLVSYTRISPNRTVNRNQPITKITIHHMAGVMSVEQFGNVVANPSREMSANYAIGNDGRIGLFCEEKDRSWCSSSPWNDHRAITIEVSNSAYGDASGWPIGDAAYKSLINLCVDICKRNGIKKLEYTGDLNGSLTRHCDIIATCCPGPWIKNHTTELCDKVNAQLNTATPTPQPAPMPSTGGTSTFKAGDLVKIKSGATYYGGGSIPSWVKEENWYIASIIGTRAVLGLNEAKNRNIQSPIDTSNITFVSTSNTSTQKTYTVSLKASDIVYRTAGGVTFGTVGSNGVFTIVEEKIVNGVTYGKLKSGLGWVVVKGNATPVADTTIKKGDKVKVLNPIIYGTNKKFVTYVSVYYVLEVNGNRVVISSDGRNVTAAIDKKNLQKI